MARFHQHRNFIGTGFGQQAKLLSCSDITPRLSSFLSAVQFLVLAVVNREYVAPLSAGARGVSVRALCYMSTLSYSGYFGPKDIQCVGKMNESCFNAPDCGCRHFRHTA